MYMYMYIYRNVPGKRPWALKHNLQSWPRRYISSIHLYRSCYINPLKWEWALSRDTTVVFMDMYRYM
jgi:hypothetical protein